MHKKHNTALFLLVLLCSHHIECSITAYNTTSHVITTMHQMSDVQNAQALIEIGSKIAHFIVTNIQLPSPGVRLEGDVSIRDDDVIDATSLIELQASIQDSAICRDFQGTFTPNTISTQSTTQSNQANCQSKANQHNTVTLGYVWPGSGQCDVISDLVTPDYRHISGVCVQRGGCDEADSFATQCVWRSINGLSLTSFFTSSSQITAKAPSSGTLTECSKACEIDSSCTGYSYRLDTKKCDLFDELLHPSTSTHTVLCSPTMTFVRSPSGCNSHEICTTQPVVSVPVMYGDAKVILETVSGASAPSGGSRIRTFAGIATFTGVSFESSGSHVIKAVASGVQCAPKSNSFNVVNTEQKTLFRFTDTMPSQFWIIRLRNNCEHIATMIGILFLVTLAFPFFFLMSGWTWGGLIVKVSIGLLLVALWHDFALSWNHWGCLESFKESFRII